MVDFKPRATRQAIWLAARLRDEAGWNDVVIANVSPRGMMLKCERPPARGAFIEIRHKGFCAIGKVIWRDQGRCGIFTRDTIDVESLLGRPQPKIDQVSKALKADRRALIRRVPAPELADASKRAAKILDWAAIALIAVVAAMALAHEVSSMLDASAGKIVAELDRVQKEHSR
ncbi:MAG: hypothetical protein ABGW87_06775 [Sphingomonadaceae bacterium]